MATRSSWDPRLDPILIELVRAAELSRETVADQLGSTRYLVVRRAEELGLFWDPQPRDAPPYQDVELRVLRRYAAGELPASRISGARLNRSPRSVQRQLKAIGRNRARGRPRG